MRMYITFNEVIRLIATGLAVLLLSKPVAAQQDGNIVESGPAPGPKITYNVSGVTLGPRTAEHKTHHGYDKGQFSPGTTIEVWGTVHNRSTTSDVLFRAYVHYWSPDKSEGERAASTGILRLGPGSHDYHISASIPDDAHQVDIRVGSTASWSSAITASFSSQQRASPIIDGPTTPAPVPPPSGDIGLTGEWDINANNHRGKITIIQQDGNQFSGTMFGNPLVNGRIDGNTITFTRLLGGERRQDYTGTLSTGPDDRATITGSFTQDGSGSYNWTATQTSVGSPTTVPAEFTVEAGKRTLSQGGSVTVPVSLNNVDGLANINVNVHYDPAVVRPARNAARGNIIPQALFEANVSDRGVIRLGFAQRDDIQGSGTLAQIPFEAVGRPGTRTPLRLEVTMASAAAGSRVTPAQLIHGEIAIVGADGRLPGDTSGEGNLTALDAMNALKMSVGNLPVDMVADMDRDGQVTARDATLILQEVVGR